MPNPATMNSLQSFDREHVNTVIHVPDYKLRRQISLQQKEPLTVEAFAAFDEMFYLHLKWTEGCKYPDFSVSLYAAHAQKMVLELSVQSPYFTYVSGENVHAVAAPQWTTCNWHTVPQPVEVQPPRTVIPLSVDRPPTQHNDGNISFEQTMTLAIVGTLWKLDDCPTDSLRCQSYRTRIQEAVEPKAASFLPRMIANIAAMKGSTEERSEDALELVDTATGSTDDFSIEIRLDDESRHRVHSFVLKAHSPVFRRMFEGSMTEAAQRSVKITDVSSAELDDFLASVYQLSVPREVQEDEARIISLLALADRYEVLPLRDECTSLLATKLSETSMAAVLKVADMHQAAELKALALAFITSRPERIVAVMDTDDGNLRTSIRDYLQTVAETAPPKDGPILLTV